MTGPGRDPCGVALVVVHDAARAYDFGPSHPLRPERVLLTYEWIRSLGLADGDHVQEIQARSATDEQILAVHSEDFVDVVRSIDDRSVPPGRGILYGLGTSDVPFFDGMHAASAAVCGASVVAAEAVVSGELEHAFNPAGGLHHARHKEASGFCIYNDLAVAIARVLSLEPDWRVMYVDVDVHHGDGVQWIFYDDPRVLTLSLHESGRYLYPGTGFEDELGEGDALGTSANIPLPPGTAGADYLWALGETLPALAEAFRPDIIVSQLGGDTHWGDPLAHLALTMRTYPRMARVLHETAHEHASGRWVATGGGGYQADTVVPRIWAVHFAEMAGAPEKIPGEWFESEEEPPEDPDVRDAIEVSVGAVLESCIQRLDAMPR